MFSSFLRRCLCTSRLCPVTGKLDVCRTEECYVELELIRHQASRFIMDSSVRCSVASSGHCVLYEKGERKDCDELPWPVKSPL